MQSLSEPEHDAHFLYLYLEKIGLKLDMRFIQNVFGNIRAKEKYRSMSLNGEPLDRLSSSKHSRERRPKPVQTTFKMSLGNKHRNFQ